MAGYARLRTAALILLGLAASTAWASFGGPAADSLAFHRTAVVPVRDEGLVGSEGSATSLAAMNTTTTTPGSGKLLSRAKRYVVFPKGSSLQLVYCASLHSYVPMTTMFVLGLTMGLAWRLPSETRALYLQRRDTSLHPDRMHRIKLYEDMETFLSSQGMRGQHCVMRTICESTRPKDEKGNFMEELFAVFFALPSTNFTEDSHWDQAYYNGTSCSARFPHCTSIIDIQIPHNK